MGKREDTGMCLLGCRALWYQVEQLREHSEAVLAMDPEGIHQMRVASRRLRAGLPIFSSCLKESQYRIWRKEIKGLTGALGEARDTDVQIEYLRSLLAVVREDQRAGVQVLLDAKIMLRQNQQGQVRGWLDNLEEEGLLREMANHLSRAVRRLEAKKPDLRGRVAYAAGLAFVTNRVTALLKLEGAASDPLDRDGHHRMRIAAKRLRYTLEAFRPLFDDALDQEIGSLKEVQDLLGEMHDCDVWLATVEDLDRKLCSEGQIDLAAVRAGLEAVRDDRGRERDALYAKFVLRWSELHEKRYFERLPERFQSALTCREINIPVLDHGRVKLAIISDVHGNMDALRAVMDDAEDQGVTGFLNLGDMVGIGPHPDEVVKALSGDRVVSVIGNIDLKVLESSRVSAKPRTRSTKGAIMAAAARDLSQESLDMIADLPPEIRLEVNGQRILMVHASPADPDEHLGPETPDSRLRKLANMADADIVMIGHSHQPFCRRASGTMFLNPGSVGRPIDWDPRASYAVLDTGDMTTELRRVEYDYDATAEAMRAKGFPEGTINMIIEGRPSSDLWNNRKVTDHTLDMEKIEKLARQMNIDHRHAEHVLALAVSLFRELQPLHGLGGHDRFLLEAGCLLHDVGAAEGQKGHHRASYRIIMETNLPLSDRDRVMVACLARYHRRRPPRQGDSELVSLDDQDRERLYRLASILRIADGLDYRHNSSVREVQCEIGEDEVVVKVTSRTDWVDEHSAAQEKADLFERTFGRKMRLA
jgi:putative phosphoesterase